MHNSRQARLRHPVYLLSLPAKSESTEGVELDSLKPYFSDHLLKLVQSARLHRHEQPASDSLSFRIVSGQFRQNLVLPMLRNAAVAGERRQDMPMAKVLLHALNASG